MRMPISKKVARPTTPLPSLVYQTLVSVCSPVERQPGTLIAWLRFRHRINDDIVAIAQITT